MGESRSQELRKGSVDEDAWCFPRFAVALQLGAGVGMTNHPPTGYVSSMRLLNKFKKTFPLDPFVTHSYPASQIEKAMATAFDIDRSMKVVITPSNS
ncbi:MAG: hypothetical protein JO163_17520 [Methylobacteriaceae bacterium]|nr:hypothetical protein [Methylobacteriaceae bacterium]MBV9704530.1 hypothetical protein [Methylobacteriaceae bacterium]